MVRRACENRETAAQAGRADHPDRVLARGWCPNLATKWRFTSPWVEKLQRVFRTWYRAAESFALRREVGGIGAGAAGERTLHPLQLREIVVRAEGHLPHIAGAAIDGVAAERFVGTGRGAFANDDEAEEPRREIRAEVHAVHLDVRIAEIDLVVVSDEGDNLARLMRTQLVPGGSLRGGARIGCCCAEERNGRQQGRGNHTTHTSQFERRKAGMQYNCGAFHR